MPKSGNIALASQLSLGFFSPSVMDGPSFRRQFSGWLREQHELFPDASLVARLFHREANGAHIQGTCPIRFTTRFNHMWIHAIGDEAVTALNSVGTVAIEKADTLPQGLSAPRMEPSNVGIASIEAADEPTAYHAPQLVICKNAEQFTRWKASDSTAKTSHIKEVIIRGVRQQCKLLGIPCPPEDQITPIDVQEHHEWTAPKLEFTANAYVRLASVSFGLPIKLLGSWSCGPLGNKGYGHLNTVPKVV